MGIHILSIIPTVLLDCGEETICKDNWESEGRRKIPIVYSEHYDITAWGLEKVCSMSVLGFYLRLIIFALQLHPFDSQKYSRGNSSVLSMF